MTAHSLLVLGGARSGKSRYAQARAEATGLKLLFVATAQAFDDEMRDRISKHRDDRGSDWETIEAPLDIADIIAARSEPGSVLLIDCLTLWTSNLILGDHDVAPATEELIAALAQATGPIVLVSNEIGFGIVPENALARKFRDEAGQVNQRIAKEVREVQMTIAGIPVTIK